MHKPRALITCGPSITPIDAVRRITNFSTGALGVHLAECLAEYGWQVTCLKGSAATHRHPEGPHIAVREFTTNHDLAALLASEPEPEHVSAVFHAAALADYEVSSVRTLEGELLEARKISSRHPGLELTLTPAPKLLPKLSTLFPRAHIVGWKFELEGDTHSALEKGRTQLSENHSALCIINGHAFGEGFGLLNPEGTLQTLPTRAALCVRLAEWAGTLVAE